MRFTRDGGKIAGARMNIIRLLPWSEWEFPPALPAKMDKPFQ
jgi:hypothetical protein